MKVAILGAGISGLTAAWYLQKRYKDAIDITIFEASDRVGGWIHSVAHEGAFFESGPRSLRNTTPQIKELILELNLQDEIIYAQDAAKKRYLVHKGTLHALPHNFLSLFGSPLGRKILLGCLREPFSRRSLVEDESVQQFFQRRIGPSATKIFISALCSGIYASDPTELSMRSCFFSFWEKEKKYGSLVKGALFSKEIRKGSSFSFRQGLATLPKTLAAKLDAKILLNTKVVQVEEHETNVSVMTDDALQHFDHLISTCNPQQFAKLLPHSDPLKELLTIQQTSLVTVSYAFKEAHALPRGFGFLCPSHEDPLLLGVVFDSLLFPEHNGPYKTRLSFMLGGSKAPDMIHFSQEALIAYVEQFAKKYLGICDKADYHAVTYASNAISRYPVGHHRLLEHLAKGKRRVHLIGSGLYGVSVGECIASAEKVINIF